MSSAGYHTVTPCRAIDTRSPPGPDGVPTVYADIPGGGTTEFVLDIVGYFE